MPQLSLPTPLSAGDAAKHFDNTLLPRDVEVSDVLEVISDDTTTTSARSLSDVRSIGTSDQDIARRLGRIEQMLSSSKIDGPELATVNLSKVPARGLMSKNRYFGPSHVSTFIRSFFVQQSLKSRCTPIFI